MLSVRSLSLWLPVSSYRAQSKTSIAERRGVPSKKVFERKLSVHETPASNARMRHSHIIPNKLPSNASFRKIFSFPAFAFSPTSLLFRFAEKLLAISKTQQ